MRYSEESDQDFIRVWKELGSPALVGKKLGMNPRSAMTRRRNLEIRYKIELPTTNSQREEKKPPKVAQAAHNVRRGIEVDKVKRILVFSDAHFTDETTTAFKALLKFIEHFKPEVIICNGDAFDGQVLSRFPSINYDQKPPRHTQRAMHSLALERLPVMMAAYQEAARMGYLQSSTNVDATQVLTCGARKIFARSWSIARCLHSLLASFSLTTAFT